MPNQLTMPTAHMHALDRLRAVHHTSFLQFALATAQVLVEDWFAGDVANYLSRDKTKAASFDTFVHDRKAELAELGLTRSALATYLRAFAVAPKLPEAVAGKLEVTKLARIASLESPELRNKVAAQAADHGWSRKDLDKAIAKAKGQKPAKKPQGRPPHPELLKAASAVAKAAQRVGRFQIAYEELSSAHKAMARDALVEAVAQIHQALARLGEA